MKSCLMILRGLVGMAQSALLLGGCGSLLFAPDYLGWCIGAFLLLCVVQVGIVILAYLVMRVSGDYTE